MDWDAFFKVGVLIFVIGGSGFMFCQLKVNKDQQRKNNFLMGLIDRLMDRVNGVGRG